MAAMVLLAARSLQLRLWGASLPHRGRWYTKRDAKAVFEFADLLVDVLLTFKEVLVAAFRGVVVVEQPF